MFACMCYYVILSVCAFGCARWLCVSILDMEFRHGGAIFISNFCWLFSALFMLRIMLLTLHLIIVFVVDHYDCFFFV